MSNPAADLSDQQTAGVTPSNFVSDMSVMSHDPSTAPSYGSQMISKYCQLDSCLDTAAAAADEDLELRTHVVHPYQQPAVTAADKAAAAIPPSTAAAIALYTPNAIRSSR